MSVEATKICYIKILYVVTHPGRLQCYHVVLVGNVPACPKFSEITNYQHLWWRLSDFVDFLPVVICILFDIRWSYQNLLFWLALSGIDSQPIRLSDVLNLKKWKTIWGIKLIVCFRWSYKKYLAILGYAAKYSWCISCRIFYFWLVWLVNFNTGGPLLHCTCCILKEH